MMKVNNNLMMETCKFITILLLYCVCTAYCYPARPLNERSPELTWQAWLLVDDQNQNQNKQQTHSDGALRRRITPKSVFIAPTFSPESLPPCAEGYSSDPMGRCIKIIKLDQEAHRDFIIQKIKERFGPIDYGDEAEEEVQTPGPFQLNIPLDVNEEDSEEDTDVAIIVSPTKTFMENIGINLDKRDSIDDENEQELFLKRLAETTTNKLDETTTVTEQSTTLNNEEASTYPEDLTSATEPVTQIITSTETRSVKRSTTEEDEKAITDPTEDYPEFTTVPPSTTTEFPRRKVLPHGFRFPEEPSSERVVKFPDSYTFQTQIPSSIEANSNVHDTGRYLNDQAVYKLSDGTVSDGRVVFRDQPHIEIANLDYSNGVQSQVSSTTTNRGFNRRNRDKHGMFLLPPRWSQANFQKPLVLRFSRKHAYLDESRFKNPDYYRSVPSDDFAYLFKFKHKQSNRR